MSMAATTTQKHLTKAKILATSSFYTITLAILSLLLPISFLLLARLSISQQHHNFNSIALPYPVALPLSFLVHSLVSIVSLGTLLRHLTRRPERWTGVQLYFAWPFLCVFQLCVGFGIEATIAAGIRLDSIGAGDRGRLWWDPRYGLFMVGLFETTLFWWREILTVVVDDALFGRVVVEKEERMMGEGVAVGVALGGLSWLLRREVVALMEMKDLMFGTVSLFSCLVYATVIVGLVRVVRGFTSLFSRCRMESQVDDEDISHYIHVGDNEKLSVV